MGGKSILTLDRKTLLEYLEYNPETGIFIWIKRPANRVKVGAVAGIEMPNATYITLKGKRFMAHRAAWLIFYGKEPENVIDHIDGDILNNSVDNLRDVDNKTNCRNCKIYTHNTSGLSGVSWWKKENCWIISGGGHSSGNFEYLGTTKDLFEAACIRKSWQLKNNYHMNHGNR